VSRYRAAVGRAARGRRPLGVGSGDFLAIRRFAELPRERTVDGDGSAPTLELEHRAIHAECAGEFERLHAEVP
jgi:hypothetical protein